MQIKTLAQLDIAADEKRSVVIKCWWNRRLPAAFVLSMQAREVLRFIRGGMFIFEPKTVRKPRKPHYTDTEWMMIFSQELKPLTCSCGVAPIMMRGGWNFVYYVCHNPQCARKVCVGSLESCPAFREIEAANIFRNASKQKLLTFP